MHVGIKIPSWGPLASPGVLVRVGVAAEERGFGSLWVSDHVVMPAASMADYPYSASAKPPFDASTPFLDPFVALAFLASVTVKVQLGTGVLVLPLRHPIAIAKQTASLDVVSRGRVVLGVGAGWMAEEFTLLDQGFTDRGRRTDHGIRTMRACWADNPELPDGGPRIGIAPPPDQGQQLPILVGGHSNAAMRRSIRYADGWYASNVTPAQFLKLVTTLRALEHRATEDNDGGCGPLIVGVRPGVVEPGDAPAAVTALTSGGADFVVLDAEYGAMTAASAEAWVHRTADALGLDGTTPAAIASARRWDAEPGLPPVPAPLDSLTS